MRWKTGRRVLLAWIVVLATGCIGQPDAGSRHAEAAGTPTPAATGTATPEPSPTSAPTPGPDAAEEPLVAPDPWTRAPDRAAPEPRPFHEPRAFTVAASGDLLIHSPVWQRAATYGQESGEAYDFRPMFDEVRPAFEAADLSICHLEVPLSAENTLSGFPRFSAPGALADAIAHAGYDACSTASNHSMDQGAGGVTETLDLLDAAGVAHTGTARTEEEAATPAMHPVEDVEVAHLSYTYGVGMPLPEGQPWMVNLIDEETIVDDAAHARDAGAEFVIASLHWGVEYRHEPTDEQRGLAESLLDTGAVDLILGHHAHVVQPVDRIGERVVVYGLGNFFSNQSAACCPAATQDGAIVRVHVEETDAGLRATDVSYVPTWVDRDTFTIVDVGAALDDPDLPGERRATLEASRDRTAAALAAAGLEPRPVTAPGDGG